MYETRIYSKDLYQALFVVVGGATSKIRCLVRRSRSRYIMSFNDTDSSWPRILIYSNARLLLDHSDVLKHVSIEVTTILLNHNYMQTWPAFRWTERFHFLWVHVVHWLVRGDEFTASQSFRFWTRYLGYLYRIQNDTVEFRSLRRIVPPINRDWATITSHNNVGNPELNHYFELNRRSKLYRNTVGGGDWFA